MPAEAAPPPKPITATDPGAAMTVEQAVGSDEAEARLHELCDPLLMYYGAKRRLPPTLDALKPLAAGNELTSPSGQPWSYTPDGLTALGTTKRIIVADPSPPASGTRSCIIMSPVAGPNAPVSLEVVTIPETHYRQYGP